MTTDLHSLGTSPQTRWLVNAERVDLTPPAPTPRAVLLGSTPQQVCFDLNRVALVIIDMLNDFCATGGWVDHLGADYTPDRAQIEPLRWLLPAWRDAGGAVVWVNWGNRPDLANMPPNQHHLYKPKGVGIGLGESLPGHGERLLQKDSWAAAVVDELEIAPTDIRVDKHRISGFWDTPLDSILRNLGTRTILFAGVNTDQCVLCTLTDANFLGYGCVLLEDCCATTSPSFCTEATLWNVRKCFGFVAASHDVLRSLRDVAG